MTALTAEEFITWAHRLAGLPWPMGTEEFAKIATGEFGWTIFDGEQVLAATFSNCSERVLVGTDLGDKVSDSLFPLGRAGSKGHVDKTLLNDLFVEYVKVGSEAWGNRSRESMVKSR